jgi:hypothetical protein
MIFALGGLPHGYAAAESFKVNVSFPIQKVNVPASRPCGIPNAAKIAPD